MEEVMKPAVSSLGRYRDRNGITKTPRAQKDGYVSVRVNNKTYSLHRLIAFAFLGPPPTPQHTIDHKDMITGNNHVDNLEWVTRQEQIKRSYAKNKDRRSHAFKQSKPVKGRKVGSEEWIGYESTNAAARILGLKAGSISDCARGKRRKTTGGYEFTWDEPKEPDSLLGEEWKRVPDLNYFVSSLGRFHHSRGVTKSPHPKKSGYVTVKVNNKDYNVRHPNLAKKRNCSHRGLTNKHMRAARAALLEGSKLVAVDHVLLEDEQMSEGALRKTMLPQGDHN